MKKIHELYTNGEESKDYKIEEFNQFLKNYPKSQYRDDALFELANALVAENKPDLAIKTYEQLIAESKNGLYSAKAILKA